MKKLVLPLLTAISVIAIFSSFVEVSRVYHERSRYNYMIKIGNFYENEAMLRHIEDARLKGIRICIQLSISSFFLD